MACASWLVIGWKCVNKFFDWKYSAKINNLIVEYLQGASRLNELKQQNDKLVGEINGLKANIKGCEEELRMMRCLTKVKSQKKKYTQKDKKTALPFFYMYIPPFTPRT